jgi:hypothetical protein
MIFLDKKLIIINLVAQPYNIKMNIQIAYKILY